MPAPLQTRRSPPGFKSPACTGKHVLKGVFLASSSHKPLARPGTLQFEVIEML